MHQYIISQVIMKRIYYTVILFLSLVQHKVRLILYTITGRTPYTVYTSVQSMIIRQYGFSFVMSALRYDRQKTLLCESVRINYTHNKASTYNSSHEHLCSSWRLWHSPARFHLSFIATPDIYIIISSVYVTRIPV